MPSTSGHGLVSMAVTSSRSRADTEELVREALARAEAFLAEHGVSVGKVIAEPSTTWTPVRPEAHRG